MEQIFILKGKMRSDVRSCKMHPDRNLYDIVFSDGALRWYSVHNVEILKKNHSINPPVRVTRAYDGRVFDVAGIDVFSSERSKAYRVYFSNGSVKDYPENYLRIERCVNDEKSVNVFNYLSDISAFSKIEGQDRTISLLQKFNAVHFISQDSTLADYLRPNSRPFPNGKTIYPIFPFGCNRSQYEAVTNALSNRLSVIQGPPGTGKTQTILNIVANLLIEGKTIEIVSNNNSAVQNIVEKLSKPEYGMDFLVAQLGKSDNKKGFVENQTGHYPDLSPWGATAGSVTRQYISNVSRGFLEMYEDEERLAKARVELDEARIQLERIPQDELYIPDRVKRKISSSSKALFLSLAFEKEYEHKGQLGFFNRVRTWYYGLGKDYDVIQRMLEAIQVKLHFSELTREVSHLSSELKVFPSMKKALVDSSLLFIKEVLFKKYGSQPSRPMFSEGEIKSHTSQFLSEYPIVLSTTFSATSNINKDAMFDYIIMDEASQVDIAAGALALNCARNAVIVGDLKQLPNVVTEVEKAQTDFTFQKYKIAEGYRFTSHSFLSSICSLMPGVPQTLLREHYRCHPYIIGFCNKQFYGGDLIPMVSGSLKDNAVCAYRSVEGNMARGAINLRQAEMICQEILPTLNYLQEEIGIIAPYNKQVDLIKRLLIESGFPDVQVSTVHKFQGREKDVIILSTVDNTIGEFVDDPHLVNVAVSRAKKKFILITTGNEIPDSNVKDLMNYINYYGGAISTSNITSVFDKLYEQNTKDRLAFLSSHQSISEELSENLLYGLLTDIMKECKLEKFDILCHYPLRLLASRTDILTDEERKYALHTWSHVDFLIFDKLTHQSTFAIEVDGFHFHREGFEQARRDSLKDAVLKKNGVPLLRLSTIGSNEREKILSEFRKYNIIK